MDDKKTPTWLVALGLVAAVWWFNSNVLNHDEEKSPSFPKPAGLLAPKRECDSNYGGCVPIAFDVDCASGSGNGPEYVAGPVRVIGLDVYDLDADGDGSGCD